MERLEDDSYTNGSVFETSVEDGRTDTAKVYDGELMEKKPADEPPADDDVALCGMPVSVPFLQQVITSI
jgi:aquaporin NIP